MVARDGKVWIGTENGGLNVYDPQTERFSYFQCDPQREDTLCSNDVRSILEDREGTIWIANEDFGSAGGAGGYSKGGLNRFLPKTRTFKQYPCSVQITSSTGQIRGNRVHDLLEDRNGRFWLGGDMGIVEFDREHETFSYPSTQRGIRGSDFRSLVESDDGYLWISTGYTGIVRFHLETMEFTQYDISDGMEELDFRVNVGIQTQDGSIYFGCPEGLVVLDGGRVHTNAYAPPTHVQRIQVLDKDIPLRQLGDDLTIHLPYWKNVLSFEFVALNFTRPLHNQYAYRLEGLEKDWVRSGDRRFARYSKISPGNYVFQVKGSNNDGVWNETGESIRIVIGSSAETPGIVIKSSEDTDTILLFRSVSTFSMFRETTNVDCRFIGQIDQPNMSDSVAAGLAVTSHSATMTENAFFTNVSITPISSLITAERTVSQSLVNPGDRIQIQVTLDAGTGNTNDAAILEIPPQGYSVSGIETTAGVASVNQSGDIEWLVRRASGQQTLTYTVTAPSTSGYVQFAGVLNVGNLYIIPISGDTLIAPVSSSNEKNVAVIRKFSLDSIADRALVMDLQSYFGVSVIEYDDENTEGYELPDNFADLSMVFLSETVTSTIIAVKNYQDSDVPQILGEQALMDEYTYQAGIGNGLEIDTQIEIIDNNHPITQGFSQGVLQVLSENHHLGRLDNPPAGVRILATEPGNPNRARLWVVEKGASVNGVVTPGLRIGTFLAGKDEYANHAYTLLTDEGKKLLAQVFAYGLDQSSPFPSSVDDYMLYK
jgi:streptogramin lyase